MDVQVELPDWMQKWHRPEVFLGGFILLVILFVAALWFGWRWSIAEDRMDMMQVKENEGFLLAPSSSRLVKLEPRRESATAPATVGGDTPERVDLAIAAPSDRFERFRVSIVRSDGTLVLHADRLVRDSNLDLRLSINTSALPPGGYTVRVEGMTRDGSFTRYGQSSLRVTERQPD